MVLASIIGGAVALGDFILGALGVAIGVGILLAAVSAVFMLGYDIGQALGPVLWGSEAVADATAVIGAATTGAGLSAILYNMVAIIGTAVVAGIAISAAVVAARTIVPMVYYGLVEPVTTAVADWGRGTWRWFLAGPQTTVPTPAPTPTPTPAPAPPPQAPTADLSPRLEAVEKTLMTIAANMVSIETLLTKVVEDLKEEEQRAWINTKRIGERLVALEKSTAEGMHRLNETVFGPTPTMSGMPDDEPVKVKSESEDNDEPVVVVEAEPTDPEPAPEPEVEPEAEPPKAKTGGRRERRKAKQSAATEANEVEDPERLQAAV